MKTIRKLLFLGLVCTYLPEATSQTNLVNNPGFETYVYNSSCGLDYWLCHAPNWTILLNSPDLINSTTAPSPPNSNSHHPRTGDANARFGAPTNGLHEYFYGSTQPLTAGQTYVVSFWVRKDYTTTENSVIGMHIGSSVPSSQVQALTPQILITPTSTQYMRAYTCYTPSTSGVHYLTFGPFGGNSTGEDQLWLMDDVSVITLDPTLPLPISNLSVPQTTYCITDDIIANGANSANETSYQWDLYEVVNGNEVLEYSSGEVSGQAGTFSTADLSAFFPHGGECFRLYLTTYGVCKDRTSVDFCFIYPTVDFITDGNPICENIPRDLQVTGDNGWTYTWSTGQSGVGLKTVTVTPTIGNSTYTVTVTTQEGCTSTKTITLVVNSQNNIAPWADGINGTGEYTYYVRQNDAVFFNSLISNDHLNESIQYTNSNTIPGSFVFNYPPLQGGIFSFSWVTSLNTPPGEYHYYLTTNDRNSCGEGISTFDFRIIVVCDQCPVCLDYEDRTPSGNPLPPETKAGKCIEAGMNQVVSTGDANVLFQAGVSITEGPYFDAGPGFEAVIEPSTCLTDCEDCCADWDGFHIDNPYYSIINFWDNDPTNNSFELTDFDHPFCSYGAKRFEMYIDDADDGSNYAYFTGGGAQCCMLQTRTPENPIPHSSIFWDGYLGGEYASNQFYRIQVILYDCNDLPHDFWFMVSVTPLGSQLAQNNSGSTFPMENTLALDSAIETGRPISDSTANSDQELGIYPNPATNMLYISGSRSETTTIQLYDEKGRVLTKREKVALNQGYNLEAFSAGTYYCRIYKNDGSYVLKQFIKL